MDGAVLEKDEPLVWKSKNPLLEKTVTEQDCGRTDFKVRIDEVWSESRTR